MQTKRYFIQDLVLEGSQLTGRIANFDALADEIIDACSRQSLLLDSGPASEDVTE